MPRYLDFYATKPPAVTVELAQGKDISGTQESDKHTKEPVIKVGNLVWKIGT